MSDSAKYPPFELPVIAKNIQPNSKHAGWAIYDATGKAITGWGQVTTSQDSAEFLAALINSARIERKGSKTRGRPQNQQIKITAYVQAYTELKADRSTTKRALSETPTITKQELIQWILDRATRERDLLERLARNL